MYGDDDDDDDDDYDDDDEYDLSTARWKWMKVTLRSKLVLKDLQKLGSTLHTF